MGLRVCRLSIALGMIASFGGMSKWRYSGGATIDHRRRWERNVGRHLFPSGVRVGPLAGTGNEWGASWMFIGIGGHQTFCPRRCQKFLICREQNQPGEMVTEQCFLQKESAGQVNCIVAA